MAVAIELQPERTPGRHPQMDQSQLCVHEVEIVVQTFAAVGPQKALAGRLVVPGLVAVAGLHGRDHMHQAGMIPPLGQYLGDHLFLANVALGDVLDRNPSLARNRRSPLTHPIAQRHGELRVVENAYALRIKNVGHASRKARPRKRSRDQNSIVAGQHTRDMLAIPFRQRTSHPASPPPSTLSSMITLFGSGFAGFGVVESKPRRRVFHHWRNRSSVSGESMTLRSLRPLDCSTRMIFCALSICLTFSLTTSPARRPQP